MCVLAMSLSTNSIIDGIGINGTFGLFAIALLLHAWVGIRDVILDYIHHFVLRIFFLTAVACVLIGCGIWLAKILLLTTGS